MDTIDQKEIRFDNSSYMDPAGRVFYLEDTIYRGFYPEISPFYRNFIQSESVNKLMTNGDLVPTKIRDDLNGNGFDLIVQHDTIPYINYCFEWADTMLKDAAIFILNLCIEMYEQKILLQDVSPYNIFFSSVKPVFIDFGSFVPAEKEIVWPAYQQFCNFFLFPLYLYANGHHDLTKKLLMDCQEGVSYKNMSSILRSWEKLCLPGYIQGSFLPRFISNLLKNPNDRKTIVNKMAGLGSAAGLRLGLSQFFPKLLRRVDKINIHKPSSTWVDYYEDTNESVLKKKLAAIDKILQDLQPESVLDVGSNTGAFSIMAARAGAKVVAFDLDHDCVSRLYELAKQDDLDILPLVINFLNPSPGHGWQSVQYPSAQQRFKCDMVFALALIHHAVFKGEQTFSRVIESLKSFHKKWLVVEYIDQKEKMIQLLPRRRGVDYSWYTLERFLNILGTYYSEVNIVEQLSDTRTLILAKV